MTFCTEGRTAHLPGLQTRKPNLKVECLETQLFVMRLEALGRRAVCTAQGTHNHDRCEELFLPHTADPSSSVNPGGRFGRVEKYDRNTEWLHKKWSLVRIGAPGCWLSEHCPMTYGLLALISNQGDHLGEVRCPHHYFEVVGRIKMCRKN